MKSRFLILALFVGITGCSNVVSTTKPVENQYQAVVYGEGCKPTKVMIRRGLQIFYNEVSLRTEDVKTGEVAYFNGNIQVTEATPEEVAAYMKLRQKDAQIALTVSLQERGVIPSCE